MPRANFEIRITLFNEEYFAITVTDAPKLSPVLARRSFPIRQDDWRRMAAPELSFAVSSKDAVLRAPGSSASQGVEAFGDRLFETLILQHNNPELTSSWESFVALSQHTRRLGLCLANEVPPLPWEALRDPRYLNLSLARQFSVVRYIPTSPPIQPWDIGAGPLRMLVVFADPEGDLSRASAIQQEKAAIQEALRVRTSSGWLRLDFVEAGAGPTLEAIKARAADHAYHILHYFGHGSSEGQGQLQLEGPRRGEPALAGWEDLHSAMGATLPSLRLVILNACELARPGEGVVKYTPFTNLAACFLNAGAALVVGMQYPIRTDTATTFTRSFYENLGPDPIVSAAQVEAAVVEGRKAIINTQNGVEWITPVVFTRMEEDAIFTMSAECFDAVTEARALFDRGLWVDAAEKVKEILDDDPMSPEGQRLKEQLLREAVVLMEQMDPRGGEVVDVLD